MLNQVLYRTSLCLLIYLAAPFLCLMSGFFTPSLDAILVSFSIVEIKYPSSHLSIGMKFFKHQG
jgi:hypothetical protein